jgi:hypothetical protein
MKTHITVNLRTDRKLKALTLLLNFENWRTGTGALGGGGASAIDDSDVTSKS